MEQISQFYVSLMVVSWLIFAISCFAGNRSGKEARVEVTSRKSKL